MRSTVAAIILSFAFVSGCGGGSSTPSESEPNDSYSQATAISAGAHLKFTGACRDVDDTDYFAVPARTGVYGAHASYAATAPFIGFSIYTADSSNPAADPLFLTNIDPENGEGSVEGTFPVDGTLYLIAYCFDLSATDHDIPYTITIDLP